MIYPLPEHITPLEYPHNVFAWDHTATQGGQAIMEMDEDEITDALEAIRIESKLKTVWSVSGIDQRYMDQPVPFEVKSLSWEGMTLTLPAPETFLDNLTWFDLW